MTLFQYLATIDADYREPGVKLLVFDDAATPEQVQAANGRVYATVDTLDENVRTPLYNHRAIVDQVIDVALYQQPLNDGSVPDKAVMMVVWDRVKDAVRSVDAHTFRRPFIALEYVTGVEPRRDPQTRGLFGSVRFRIHSAR